MMSPTSKLFYSLIFFLFCSCSNHYGFKEKKHWDYYKNIGGSKDWRYYRRVWGNSIVGDSEWYDQFLRHYNFKVNEKIASIGADMGIAEILYGYKSPKLNFFLEDINAKNLNNNIFDDLRSKMATIHGSRIESQFTIVIGNKKETNLPVNFFDKVLIEKSLHEFEFPDEMLENISTIVINNGTLFISDHIRKNSSKKERNTKVNASCERRYFTENELVKLVSRYNFRLVSKYHPTAFENFLIYEFKKNGG